MLRAICVASVFFLVTNSLSASPEKELAPEYDNERSVLVDDYSDEAAATVEDEPLIETLKDKAFSLKPSGESLLDYQAILGYIKGKYKKITNEDAEEISKSLVEFGEKNEIDPKVAAALIARESAFNKEAVSRTGAQGLGQIKSFNFKQLNISNPHDIKENVSGTTQYLSYLVGKWKDGIKAKQGETTEKTNAKLKRYTPELLERAEKNEKEQVKLALASYYKGFTAVNKEGVDEKTTSYVDDIMNLYDEIVDSKNKLLKRDDHTQKTQ